MKTKFEKLPISIIFDKIICQFQFIKGSINFKQISYDIKTIDINFPNLFASIIYKMSKFIIIKAVEGQSKTIQNKF